MAAEAGADDADVDVLDRLELPRRALGARVERALGGLVGGDALLVDAEGVDQALDQIGDGVGEDGLLVGHRAGVVDHQQEIDLVDAALRELVIVGVRALGVVGREGPIETASHATDAEHGGSEEEMKRGTERADRGHDEPFRRTGADPGREGECRAEPWKEAPPAGSRAGHGSASAGCFC